MAGLFAKLRASVETGRPATPATPATPLPVALPPEPKSSSCSESSSVANSENALYVEPDDATTESDRIEALTEALTEKAGAFIGDGIEQAEADRLAVVVVQCRTCAHYHANENNPEAGMGRCAVDGPALSRSPYLMRRGLCAWPNAPRYCARWVAGGDQCRSAGRGE